MKKLVVFAEQTPSKAEVLKRFEKALEGVPKLNEEIASIQARIKSADNILGALQTEEEKHRVAIRNRLVNELPTTEVAADLNKILGKISDKRIEVEGLALLLAKENKELEACKKQIEEREMLLALADLYVLYDQYNKQAADLAGTIQGIIEAQGKAGEVERASGLTFIKHVNPIMAEGAWDKIPSILWDIHAPDISGAEKYFWHRLYYSQDTTRRIEEAARQ